MVTHRSFHDADRYKFDFGICSHKNGFAQIDTNQDAWYFGNWANPSKLVLVSYCEGDVTVQRAESEAEFVFEIRRIKEWNVANGWQFSGIDPMGSDDIEAAFVKLGLGDLIH